ncbi:hypothetical protein RSOLAG1IB_11910 [Rhizoctonia solani AG-1 IB]|uniref:Protein kinase domain-containing protein n=1 Tax=Thanatephorus cucumeris (strain AG1-IB / isolate 7/3/14) TaxID=1108050 RepID=A0A0B7FHA5_THACB|nr:hypothetical protein RSOLAG1IB_11910 [Rhizoctonia solani AG-1 IB]
MSSASTICITDFGCSTIKGASLAFPSSDVDSGTIRWTAPEILLSDKGKPSYKGDIHSLGMTILEVLTGSIPYSDTNEAEALSRVTQGRVPERPLEQVPKGSKQADAIWLLLVQNCWALEPKDRISAVDLHYQIKAIHEGGE